MGCGGSTPVIPVVSTRNSPVQPQRPQQIESPCLGLEDDYEFKDVLGQGEASGHAECSHSCVALFWQHPSVKMLVLTATCAAGGTAVTHLAEDRKTKELVAIKLIKRPIPRVMEQNILREIVVRAQLALASCPSTHCDMYMLQSPSQVMTPNRVRCHLNTHHMMA